MKKKKNEKKFPSRPQFPFVLLSLPKQKAKEPTSNAVVHAPPRGQQARPRPTHERPGEGRGAREFFWKKEDEGGEEEEQRRCSPLFFSALGTDAFFHVLSLSSSSSVLMESCPRLWRGRIARERGSEGRGKRPFLLRRWFFVFAMELNPFLRSSPSSAPSIPASTTPISPAWGLPRRGQAPGMEILSKERAEARRIGHSNCGKSDTAFFCFVALSLTLSLDLDLFAEITKKQKRPTGARLRPRQAHVRRPGGK